MAIRRPTLDEVFLQLTGHRTERGAGTITDGAEKEAAA